MKFITQLIGFVFDLAFGLGIVALISWGIASVGEVWHGWVFFGVFGFMSVCRTIGHHRKAYLVRQALAERDRVRTNLPDISRELSDDDWV